MESGIILGKLTAGTRRFALVTVPDRFSIAFPGQSPGGLHARPPGSRLRPFQTRSWMPNIFCSFPLSPDWPSPLETLFRSGVTLKASKHLLKSDPTPNSGTAPRSTRSLFSDGLAGPPDFREELDFTRLCVIPDGGEDFPTRTLIRRYLQTKVKRDDERGLTYHVYFHQGKVASRSGESVVSEGVADSKTGLFVQQAATKQRFLRSDYPGHIPRFQTHSRDHR